MCLARGNDTSRVISLDWSVWKFSKDRWNNHVVFGKQILQRKCATIRFCSDNRLRAPHYDCDSVKLSDQLICAKDGIAGTESILLHYCLLYTSPSPRDS